jgi:hypothetical protein
MKQHYRIILVDDESNILDILKPGLEFNGFSKLMLMIPQKNRWERFEPWVSLRGFISLIEDPLWHYCFKVLSEVLNLVDLIAINCNYVVVS